MRRILMTLPFISLIFGFGFSENYTNYEVLVLHSYHAGMLWTDSVIEGIKSVFPVDYSSYIKVRYEFMDTKTLSSDDYYRQLVDIFKDKYSDIQFDVMIVCDDNAYNFVLDYHDELFSDTPVVFLGVNYLDEAKIEGIPWITGVVEDYDLVSTIEVALTLHPGVDNIFVVNDNTTTGLANRKRIEEVIPLFENELSFEFSGNESMREILRQIEELDDSNLILLMSFNRDGEGQVYSYRHSLGLISSQTDIPIYGIWDFYLGRGIVGGMLISGESQGLAAGEMALRILNGESPGDISIINESPNSFKFDYKELLNFDISISDLPEGSVVINKPLGIFKKYKGLFIIFIIVVLVLLALLIISRVSHLKTRKDYLHSEERYRKLAEASFESIAIHIGHTVMDVNERFSDFTGYSMREAKGMNIRDLFADESLSLVKEKGRKGVEVPFEAQIKTKDGRLIWVEACGKNIKFQRKSARVITFHDIDQIKKSEEALKSWFKFEKTVAQILSHFVDISDIDKVLNASFRDLGVFTGADRAYLFLFSLDGNRMDNTHEWCAEGVEPFIDKLKNLSISDFPWWAEKISAGDIVNVRDVSKLPPEADEFRKHMETEGIESVVNVPVRRKGTIIGFIGFDSNRFKDYWKEEHIAILRLFAEVVGKVVVREK